MSSARPTDLHESPETAGLAALGDEELFARICANDPVAFQALYSRHQRFLFNLSLQIAASRQQAEEAFQEAMIRIWRSARNFKPNGNARGWMAQILVRECLKRSPSRVKRRECQAEMALEELEQHAEVRQDEADRSEQLALLRRGIASLPAESRRILMLYYGAGFKQRQIGRWLKLPQSTISHQLTQALSHLRREMLGPEARLGWPALLEGLLAQELCGLQEPSAELTATVHRRIAASGAPARPHPLAFRGSTAWLAAGIAASCILLPGLWPGSRHPGTAPAHVPATAGPALEPAQAPHVPMATPGTPAAPSAATSRLHRVWTFEQGMPKDFVVFRGAWSYWQPSQDGQMAGLVAPAFINNAVLFSLPVKIPARPLRITARVQVPLHYFRADQRVSGGLQAHWYFGAQPAPPVTMWINQNRHNVNAPIQLDYEIYIHQRWIISKIRQATNWSTLLESADPYPAREIAVGVSGYALQRLAIEEIGPEEIPDPVRTPEGVKALVERPGSGWFRRY